MRKIRPVAVLVFCFGLALSTACSRSGPLCGTSDKGCCPEGEVEDDDDECCPEEDLEDGVCMGSSSAAIDAEAWAAWWALDAAPAVSR